VADELRINVGVGGAKEAEAALKGVAGAEQGIGAAAQTGAAGIARTAAAKKAAGEAAHELTMRDQSLLRQVAMISPEFAIAADVINQFATKTTQAGLALGLIGAGIAAVTVVISRYNESQAEQKRKAEELIAVLRQQYEEHLKIEAAQDRMARGRGGAGAAAMAGLQKRLYGLAPEGVGPGDIKRAGELIAKGGRGVTDEEAIGLMLQIGLGKEPEKGTDRAKARRMLGGQDLGALRAEMATVPGEVRRQLAAETQIAGAAFRPEAGAEQALAMKAQAESAAGVQGYSVEERKKHLAYAFDRARAGEAWAIEIIRTQIAQNPELAGLKMRPMTGWESVRAGVWGGSRVATPNEPGTPISVIVQGDVNQGAVVYKGQDSDPAGQIPRSTMR
jgi:hypothetical protein